MFTTLFFTILRTIAIPIVAILILRETPLGYNNAFLVVAIALSITNIITIIFQVIKILPNMVLLRGNSIMKLALRISIEVFSIIGFWIYYLTEVA